MSREPVIRRCARAALALLLMIPLVGGHDPDCPHHQAPEDHAQPGQAQHGHTHHGPLSTDSESEHSEGSCRCIGFCQGSSATPIVSTYLTPSAAAREVRDTSPLALTTRACRAVSEYVLPYANGPPSPTIV